MLFPNRPLVPLSARNPVHTTNPSLAPQWQQLRQRFWEPEGGVHQRAVWAALDAATAGVRQAAPMLERPVELARRWFAAAHPAAQQQQRGGAWR